MTERMRSTDLAFLHQTRNVPRHAAGQATAESLTEAVAAAAAGAAIFSGNRGRSAAPEGAHP